MEMGQYVTFKLQNRIYSIPAGRILRIQRYSVPVPLPGAPAYVLGVVLFEGRPLPVLDLAQVLGLGTCPLDQQSCLVLCKLQNESPLKELALVVEDCLEVYSQRPLGGGRAITLLEPSELLDYCEKRRLGSLIEVVYHQAR